MNYAAVAAQVNRCLNVELSAKQVKTAIEHLRRGQRDRVKSMPNNDLQQQLESLLNQLRTNHAALVQADRSAHVDLDRDVAVSVLSAVRAAATESS